METENNNEELIQLVKTTATALCNYIKSKPNPCTKENKKVYVISKNKSYDSEVESSIVKVFDNIDTAKKCIRKLFDNIYAEYTYKYDSNMGVHKVTNRNSNIIERYDVWGLGTGVNSEIEIILTEHTISNSANLYD